VNPENPNYRNDDVSANYRNDVSANAATAITSKQYFFPYHYAVIFQHLQLPPRFL
jgi:hypothetical protein